MTNSSVNVQISTVSPSDHSSNMDALDDKNFSGKASKIEFLHKTFAGSEVPWALS